jgi:hypothetical protein
MRSGGEISEKFLLVKTFGYTNTIISTNQLTWFCCCVEGVTGQNLPVVKHALREGLPARV